MKKYIKLGMIICLFGMNARAQSFIGNNFSDGTAYGVIFNPASIAGSPYKYDINIVSANALVGNTAYSVNKGKYFALKFKNLKENEDYHKISNDDDRNLWSSIDILGPSLMVSLTDKDAIAVTTRFRMLTGVHGLADELLQTFGQQNFLSYYGENFSVNNFRSDLNMFMDLGASYGRVLVQNSEHSLRAGISLKYLLGFAGGTENTDNMLLNIKNVDTVSRATGNINLVYSDGVDAIIGKDGTKNYNTASGFGLDLGLVYEWHSPNATPMQRFFIPTSYKLRISAAVTDLGHINYKAANNSRSYSVNMTNVPTEALRLNDNESIDDYINRLQQNGYLEAKTDIGNYKISLPTLLRINADCQVFQQWYLNADANINLVKRGNNAAVNISYFTLTPRYEFRWFSLYMPISYNTMKEFNLGFGANFGIAFIGSGSVITNLFKSGITNGDVYMGVHLPLQKKQVIRETNTQL